MRVLPFLLLLQACTTTRIPAARPVEVARDEYELSAALFPGGAPPRSMDVVEALVDPVAVRGWSRDALLLADGRAIPLGGAGDLRRHSFLLAETTREGVEARDGTIVGLIRVWHWCGNDPVARHVARIDLTELLRYHDVDAADPDVAVPVNFNPLYGWDVVDFHDFREWQASRAPRAARSRAFFIVRKNQDVLVVFGNGRYARAQGSLEAKGHAKVSGGRFPAELLSYLRDLVTLPTQGSECLNVKVPATIEAEDADFVFDVLRRQ